jgi:CheY-like chemotaxis protein
MRRILIVDDNPGIVALARAILSHDGNAIRTAATGEEALALLALEPADVVVLDVEMPGISGWDTLRAIRGDRRLDGTRVVMHSATHPIAPPTADYPSPDRILGKPSSAQTLVTVVAQA